MPNRLSALAQETSSEKRRELMSEVADLFVSGAEIYSDRELFLFGEILIALLDRVDSDARVELSEKVAKIKTTPRELALTLANDIAAVAVPILQYSPVLTESDLIEIASTRSAEYRLAISKRVGLSAGVTDALIVHGEKAVLHAVCGNRGSKISVGGYNTLVDCARLDADLRHLLSHRADMPVQILKRVLPLLPPQAQAQLKEIVKVHGGAVIEELVDKVNQKSKKASQDNKRYNIQAHILLQDIQTGKQGLPPVIEMLCQKNRTLDIGFILSGVANLPEQQVVSALMKTNSQAIVVLCRALELPERTFQCIAELRRKRFKLPVSSETKLMVEYLAMDIVAAQRTMRFVKVRNTNDQPENQTQLSAATG